MDWWSEAAVGCGPLVAVTQRANTRSRRLLENLGMILLEDGLQEYGALQCLYTSARTEDDVLRWARLYGGRLEEAERRLGGWARATELGAALPADLSALSLEEMARSVRPGTVPTGVSALTTRATVPTCTWAGPGRRRLGRLER